MKKLHEEIIEEFEKEFCNNHQKPIRFLRSIFYDEQDGAEQIEIFLENALNRQLDEIVKVILSMRKEPMYAKQIMRNPAAVAIISKYKENYRHYYNVALNDIIDKLKGS